MSKTIFSRFYHFFRRKFEKEKKPIPLISEKGYTLIEVILIVVLAGILSLTVGLNYNRDTYSAQGALLRVMGDVRYAHELALVSGQTYGFRTLTNQSYEVYQGAPGNPVIDPLTKGSLVVNLVTNYPNITFAGNYEIRFGAGGAPTLGGGQNYTLQGPGGNRSFKIEAATGVLTRL